MGIKLEDALFRPRGVAIVGASNDPTKLSGRPLDYLLRMGFKGGIYAINPKRAEVQGTASYRALRDVSGPIDLAIVVVPAVSVPQALRECAEVGVTAAIVFASGFAEMGGKGCELQDAIVEIASKTGLRVIGPNCLGAFSIPSATYATFSSAFDEQVDMPDDAIALVSQSGAVGTAIFATMLASGVGVRHFANTGNESDVTVPELLRQAANSDDVDLIIGHMEDARRLDLLERAAADAQRNSKPMILVKAGSTPPGARAVKFHTGAAPGNDAEFQALIARHGAIRVEGIEAAADAAIAFRSGRRSNGRRLAIFTSSGGAAALATDAAIQMGLQVNEPNAAIRTRLGEMLPEYGSTANPIDLTGALLTNPTLLEHALSVVIPDPDVDMILIVLVNADRGAEGLVNGIHRCYLATNKPFCVAWAGGSGRPRRALFDLRIPTYSDPYRAVRALQHVADFSRSTRIQPK